MNDDMVWFRGTVTQVITIQKEVSVRCWEGTNINVVKKAMVDKANRTDIVGPCEDEWKRMLTNSTEVLDFRHD